MSKKKKKETKGFARTKNIPHKRHPANFKKTGKDDVEYIAFTHHPLVEINGVVYETIPLTDSISKIEREKNKNKSKKDISYAFPKVFVGSRSALGSTSKDFSFNSDDYQLVKNLFNTLPKEKVVFTSNSRKVKKKKT